MQDRDLFTPAPYIATYVSLYKSLQCVLLLEDCAYKARAQQNRCRHRLWRHVLFHVAFERRRTEKLSDDLSTLKLINDNNNKLGATWNLSIYDCGCSKSIVDVLSVRDNGFSRSYWSFFIGVPFARKIAQVSRLSCKYFFIHRSKVRGLQVCSTLRPCHVCWTGGVPVTCDPLDWL